LLELLRSDACHSWLQPIHTLYTKKHMTVPKHNITTK
jgi:hypothetical protein